MKSYGYDIVFQEVPGEVSLSLSITNCLGTCKGCHSPWLREDIGTDVEESLSKLLPVYGDFITCVLFLGEGKNFEELVHAMKRVQREGIKTALYSGREEGKVFNDLNQYHMKPDYVKTGPYVEALGALDSKTTNQRMYRLNCDTDTYEDITYKFWEKKI